MAREDKYGLDVPQIPDGEPIILFRAQDAALPAVLEAYAVICKALGSPESHTDHIRALRTNVTRWQTTNRATVKPPD